FVAIQLFWNLGSRHHRGLEPTLRSMDEDAEQLHETGDLVAMPYSSQAGGFFTNWLEGDEETRLKAERSGYATKANFQIAGLAGEIARRNGVPVGAVVLAFLRLHPFYVVPIIGCGTPAHLAAQARIRLVLFDHRQPHSLVDAARKHVFTLPVVEKTAHDHCSFGRELVGSGFLPRVFLVAMQDQCSFS